MRGQKFLGMHRSYAILQKVSALKDSIDSSYLQSTSSYLEGTSTGGVPRGIDLASRAV